MGKIKTILSSRKNVVATKKIKIVVKKKKNTASAVNAKRAVIARAKANTAQNQK